MDIKYEIQTVTHLSLQSHASSYFSKTKKKGLPKKKSTENIIIINIK